MADFFYTQYNLSYPMFVPNFKILSTVVPEKPLMTKKKMEKKKNGQIKGLIYVADSFIHSTTCHTQCLYQISKS